MANDLTPKPHDGLAQRARAWFKDAGAAIAAHTDEAARDKLMKRFAAVHAAALQLEADAAKLGVITLSGGEPTV
jgi:hypothetical protein